MMHDWATQVAWVQASMMSLQASMMSQMGWPLPQEYEAEYADYAEQEEGFHEIDISGELLQEEGFREIDISGTLLRVSSEGIAEVEKATLAADCLRLQLATVKNTLEYVSDAVYLLPAGDDVEPRAARALRQVDELLRQQAAQEAPPLPAAAVKSLRVLQRHSADVVLLACSRFISQTILQSQGVPRELLIRLEAAFVTADLQDDSLWSRIGNSKFHVFTEGMRFGSRPHRHGRRKSRRSQEADATDEPMFIDLPDLLIVGTDGHVIDVGTDGHVIVNEPMFIDVGTDGHVIMLTSRCSSMSAPMATSLSTRPS